MSGVLGGGLQPVAESLSNSVIKKFSDLEAVIDNDLADTPISDIAEPANPQVTIQLLAQHFLKDNYVKSDSKYRAIITIGGKNLQAAASRTINATSTLNGVNVINDSRLIFNNLFWGGLFTISDVKINDIVGIKMWVDIANDIDYRYVTVYVFPENLFAPSGGIMQVGSPSDFVQGAIAGVSYIRAVPGNPIFLDFVFVDANFNPAIDFSINNMFVSVNGENINIDTTGSDIRDDTVAFLYRTIVPRLRITK